MKRRKFLGLLTAVSVAGVSVRPRDALAAQMSLDGDDQYWLSGRAWLGMIAAAELGPSYIDKSDADTIYRTAYTHKVITDADWDHPRERAASPIPGTNLSSDAFGPYQIISTTLDQVRRNHPNIWLAEPPMSPANQDRAALALSWDAGGHQALLDGCRVAGGHMTVAYDAFCRAVYADSIEWASLPGHDIGADTGQHTKPLWWLWSQFQWALWRQLGYRRKVADVLPDMVNRKVTSPMGPRWGRLHGGTDLEAAVGEPVMAPEACKILRTRSDSRAGKYIVLSPIAFPELELSLCHLSEILVQDGEQTAVGQIIGRAGATGKVTGPHLHVGAWIGDDVNGWGIIDPYRYLMQSVWY